MQTLKSLLERLQRIGQQISQTTGRLWVRFKVEQRLIQFARLLMRLWRFLKTQYDRLPPIPLTPIQWILVLYVVFSLFYVWATPVFEASEELWHFGYVQSIREDGALPVQDVEDPDALWLQHGSQPPLYYAIASVLTAPADISDVDSSRIINPYVQIDRPFSYGNKNLIVHPEQAPPLTGTVLAVTILRVFGVGMGVLTIISVFGITRLIAPKREIAALVAASLTAFNPMFLFVMASVNNDVLVIALNSVVIYLLVRLVSQGFDFKLSLALAVMLALATLTKLSALVLLPIVLLVGFWMSRRDENRRGFLVLMGVVVVAWVVIAGWWFVRNIQLYNEPFGIVTMAQIAGPRAGDFSPWIILEEFGSFRLSYWGMFGLSNIQMNPLFYLLMDFVTLLSVGGAIFMLLQLGAIRDFSYARRQFHQSMVLVLVVIVGLLGVLFWSLQTPASEGRLLFPFIAAVSPIMALGLIEVIWWMLYVLRPPEGWRSIIALEVVPEDVLYRFMLWPLRFISLIAVLVPFMTIAPQYTPPQPLDTLPTDAKEIYVQYDELALVGYRLPDRRYAPGSTLDVTLYWQVLEQSERDYTLALTLVRPDWEPVGQFVSYPGNGTLRTSTWEAGKIYPDRYQMTVMASSGRYPIQLQIDWLHQPTGDIIIPVNEEGDEQDTLFLAAGAFAGRPDLPEREAFIWLEGRLIFEPSFTLSSYRMNDDERELWLWWDISNPPDGDYAAFVQVRDDDGNILDESTYSPLYATHYWIWGESYVTTHRLDFTEEELASGEYEVLVGWFDMETGERVVINDEEYPDRAYPLTIEVYEGEVDDEFTDETDSEATSEPTAEVTVDAD